MPKPSVSVVIPTYNRSALLKQAVLSVLAQTYTDFEIIVVDDGSTDDTRQVVEGLRDPRVRYVWQQNQQRCVARNHGIREARGQWIAFLDSDDLWFPNRLRYQFQAMVRNPGIGFVYCGSVRVDERGRFVYPQDFLRFRKTDAVTDKYSELLVADCLTSITPLIDSDLLREVGEFDATLRHAEDWDMWIRMAGKTKFLLVDQALTAVRIHTGNRSGNPLTTLPADMVILDKHMPAGEDTTDPALRTRAEMHSYARAGLSALVKGLAEAGDWLKAAEERSRRLDQPDALRSILLGNAVDRAIYSGDERREAAGLLRRAAEVVGFDARQLMHDYWLRWTHICYKLRDYRAAFGCARQAGLIESDRGIKSIAARSMLKTLMGQAKGRLQFSIERELPAIIGALPEAPQ